MKNNGEDHLYQRKNSRIYYIRYSVVDENGKVVRDRKSLGTTNLQVAITQKNRYIGDGYGARRIVDIARRVKAFELLQQPPDLSVLRANSRGNRAIGAKKNGAILDQFLADRKKNRKTKTQQILYYRSSILAFFNFHKDHGVSAVSSQMAVEFRDALFNAPLKRWVEPGVLRGASGSTGGKTISAKTINNVMHQIRTFYKWLIRNGYAKTNSTDAIEPTVGNTTREKRLYSHDEADALCNIPAPANTDPDEWRVCALCARYSGARLGEICSLSKDDVVWDGGIPHMKLITEKQKNAKAALGKRDVPIASKLRPHLRSLWERTASGFLFPSLTSKKATRNGDLITRHWIPAAKKVVPKAIFHGWRTYVTSELTNNGVEYEWCERIVGHNLGRMQERYLVIDIEKMREFIELIY